MAGGAGSRLAPLTRSLPKPLVPVGNIPIIEILIRQLVKNDIKEIIIALGKQGSLIRTFLSDGKNWGAKIRYSVENKPLGTVGPLRLIDGLKPNFLVLNGDLLTDLDFKELSVAHFRLKAPATVAICRRSVKSDFGVVTSRGERIVSYAEKPRSSWDVSMGIYALSRESLKNIPRRRFDFPELISNLAGSSRPPAVYRFKGVWLDIGRLEDWKKADRLFVRNPKKFF